MLLQDQILDIQYSVGDIEGNVYSPYQIMNALNTVIRQVNAALSNVTSDLTKTRIPLTLISGAVDLPLDFVKETRVTDPVSNYDLLPRTTELSTDTHTYEILNNQLIANLPTVVLTYKKFFNEMELTMLTSVMPFPDFFKDVVTLYTKVTLQGAVGQGDASVLPPIEQKVMQLVAGRGKGRLYTKMPFRV
jgi:hypothetical protein